MLHVQQIELTNRGHLEAASDPSVLIVTTDREWAEIFGLDRYRMPTLRGGLRSVFLFRTSKGHHGVELSAQPMSQPDAWRMIRKRAAAVGIFAPIGNHSFRATGITAYLANGGALEHAQEMAAHESPRTTKLYDRTKDRLTQDEVERIRL